MKNVDLKNENSTFGNTTLTAVHCYPIFEYEVKGVSTHYIDKVWVDNENELDGGFYTNVEKRHKNPKVIVSFCADVNIELLINGQYYDGTNMFTAVGKRTLRNTFTEVDRFQIPKEIALVSTSRCG